MPLLSVMHSGATIRSGGGFLFSHGTLRVLLMSSKSICFAGGSGF